MTPNSRSPLHKIGANISWLIGERMLRMVIGVFVLGMIGRHLGPAEFAYLNYALGLTLIFAHLANLGIDGIVIRELVRRPGQSGEILGTAVALRLFGGIGAITASACAALMVSSSEIILPLTVIIGMGFLPQSADVIDLWFQKNIQSRFVVIARLTALLFGSAVKVFLVMAHKPLIWFGGALAFDYALASIALSAMYVHRGESFRPWHANWPQARCILRESWPLIFAGLLVAFHQRLELIMVMEMLGEVTGGIFSAATRLAEIWLIIPGAIMTSVYPLLIERKKNGQDYQALLQAVLDLLTVLGYGIALGTTAFSWVVIPFVFGDAYRDAIPILVLTGWTAPILYNATVRAYYMLIEGKTVYHIGSALLGIAVTFALAIHFIPELGARGAVLATIGGYLISGVITSFFFVELRPCGWLQLRSFLIILRWKSAWKNGRSCV